MEFGVYTREIAKSNFEQKPKFDPDQRFELKVRNESADGKNFDPDQRFELKVRNESADGKNFDPDQRFELKVKDESVEKKFNPDKWFELKAKDESVKIEQGANEAKSGEEINEKQKGLTEEEKEKIKEETGWSDEIINHIDSMDQYEIYKKADLHEVEINGKKCLVKDIDMDYVDPKTGLTNRELMAKGRAPIDAKTGEKIELHHMGQDKDGPFAELCENSEHGDGNHGTLHPKTDDSWRNESGASENYNNERVDHWKTRAQEA